MLKKIFILVFILCLSVSGAAFAYEKDSIAVVFIGTGKYIQFFDRFYQKLEKFFIPEYKKEYFVFTDDLDKKFPKNTVLNYQPHLDWPGPTIKRWHYIYSQKEKLKNYNYICFLNANMVPLKEISKDILPNADEKMMFTLHPMYYKAKSKNLPYDRNEKSTAFMPYGDGQNYYMGGLVCGVSDSFLQMANKLRQNTDEDEKNGAVALWHDESHLNKYAWDLYVSGQNPKIITPEYAMPEEVFDGTQSVKNLKEFQKSPYMIILDKRKLGGHEFLRKKWAHE